MQHVANVTELHGRPGAAAIEVAKLSHAYASADGDVPAHYAFKIRSDVASLRREYERAKSAGPRKPAY